MEKLVILVIIGVLSLASSIIKNAREKKKNAQRAEAAPKLKQRVESEIDAFLTEVGARAPDAVPPPRKQSPRARQPQHRRQKLSQSGTRVPQPRRRQRSGLTAQPKSSTVGSLAVHDVGTGINKHVESYIADHVAENVGSDVSDHVRTDIVQSAQSHLGLRSSEMPSPTENAHVTSRADSIRRTLQQPEGVRQAIVLYEVLKHPVALRR